MMAEARKVERMIVLRCIEKRFAHQDADTAALRRVSLDIRKGESVAIVGRSASGKSTLLNVMSTLVTPTSGEYRFDGQLISGADRNAWTAVVVRRRSGYIGQISDLLGNFDVATNVGLAASCRNTPISREEAEEHLAAVGLVNKGARRPSELSGGERQRVSIARTLAARPQVVFADEPTGSLDVVTAGSVMDALFGTTREAAQPTLVLVTHAPQFAALCTRQVCVRKGVVAADERGLSATDIVEFLRA